MNEPAATKPCPFCGEQILPVAIKCRHCQSDLQGGQSSVVQAAAVPTSVAQNQQPFPVVRAIVLAVSFCIVPRVIAAVSKPSLAVSVVLGVFVLLVINTVVLGRRKGETGFANRFSSGFMRHSKSNIYFLFLVVFGIGIGFVERALDGTDRSATPASVADEAVFVAAMAAEKDNYGGNDIEKSRQFNGARAYERQFFRRFGNQVKNWSGWVSDLSTDKGGSSLSLRVKIGDRSLTGFDIAFKEGWIWSRSSVYQSAASLRERACVVFSGVVNPREDSSTEHGAMIGPVYEIEFTELKPCEPGMTGATP